MDKLGKILIVDDNEDVLFAEKVKVAVTPERIEHFMRTFGPDLILLDMNFSRDVVSGQEGFDALRQILRLDPQAVVIFMTAYADTDKAVRAIKAGATDFIPKPWEKEKLLATLSSGMKLRRSRCEVSLLKEQVEVLSDPAGGMGDDRFIGRSEPMRQVLATVEKLREADATMYWCWARMARARTSSPGCSTAVRPVTAGRSSPSTWAAFPSNCSRASSSATRRAPSPTPARPRPGVWRQPRAARSSSTRLATSPCPCKPSC